MRERNLQIVRTMLERGLAGDFESIRQYISDDFVATEAESLPYPGLFKGFDGYVGLMVALSRTWEGLGFDVEQLIADDKTVAIRGTLRGRRGEHAFEMPVVEMWDFLDEKLVASRPFYFDTKEIADIYAATRDVLA